LKFVIFFFEFFNNQAKLLLSLLLLLLLLLNTIHKITKKKRKKFLQFMIYLEGVMAVVARVNFIIFQSHSKFSDHTWFTARFLIMKQTYMIFANNR